MLGEGHDLGRGSLLQLRETPKELTAGGWLLTTHPVGDQGVPSWEGIWAAYFQTHLSVSQMMRLRPRQTKYGQGYTGNKPSQICLTRFSPTKAYTGLS